MEEIQTDTVEVNDVTPVTSGDDVTPAQTQSEQETQSETQEISETETSESTKEVFLGTYKTKEEAEKGLKEKDSYITKLSQELTELKRTQEQKQYEQQKAQVESGTSQLKNEYNSYLQQMRNTKKELTAQALTELQDSGDISTYTNYLAQLDEQYEYAKRDLDSRYQIAESEFQKQQTELSTFAQQKVINDFKSANAEFCETHAKVIDAYLSKGYDPQDLSIVKELLEIALAERDSNSLLSTENQQAKQRLNTAISIGKSSQSNDGIPTTWGAIVDKMDSDPKWYMANIKQIQQMKAEGKIK